MSKTEITAASVKELRDRTDMPMMKCKAALEKAGGDMDKALLVLREEGGKFLAGDKGARETAEGRIAVFTDVAQKVGAILELRCETPSVVKNDRFVELANELAKQVALKSATSVDDLMAQPLAGDPNRKTQDRLADVVGLIRENMRVARFQRVEGQTGGYVHHDGTLGVLLNVSGEAVDPAILRDICAHIAALTPRFALTSEIPADVQSQEKEFAKKMAAEQAVGKPENIVEMIGLGKYNTWLKENVLVEQEMANTIKYGKKTVGQVLKDNKADVVGFIRYKVGAK